MSKTFQGARAAIKMNGHTIGVIKSPTPPHRRTLDFCRFLKKIGNPAAAKFIQPYEPSVGRASGSVIDAMAMMVNAQRNIGETDDELRKRLLGVFKSNV